MIENVLRDIRNFFVKTVEYGTIQITSNKLIFNPKQTYLVGQYVYIKGSVLNDSVQRITLVELDGITLENLSDEQGSFTIYGLAIPKAIVDIATEIETSGNTAGVQSESLGDYSVSYGEKGGSWQQVYKNQLDPYRKVYLNLNGAC